MSRLPDFIVIGAMKSGTTTLYEYLNAHPQIFMCTPKEPRFFSLDENYKKGIDWYSELFDDAAPHQLVGEASTCYSRWPFHPDVIERLQSHLRTAKFIYMMRDPVSRAYSHYKHRMEERLTADLAIAPFDQAIEEDPEILETGLYAKQINKYLDAFERGQVSMTIFEEFKQQPVEHLNDLLTFLGAAPLDRDLTLDRHNPSGSVYARKRIARGAARLRHHPAVSPLVDKLSPALRASLSRRTQQLLSNSLVNTFLMKRFQKSIDAFREQDRSMLRDYYRRPNEELEQLLGRNIECWASYRPNAPPR